MISRCTTSKRGRVLSISKHDRQLENARKQWKDPLVVAEYRQYRPMVERSISWLVANNHRRVRYRGIERNQFGLQLRVAALNLRRLVNLGLHHNRAWVLPA